MTGATEVRERGIIMTGPSPAAILDGRKTQTRRVVKLDEPERVNHVEPLVDGEWEFSETRGSSGELVEVHRCPYGVPGDRLWVRETWAEGSRLHEGEWSDAIVYRADHADLDTDGWGWKSPRFMSKRYARIWLELTDVRVERVQDITEADAEAEGLRAQAGDGGAPGAGYKWTGIGYEGAMPGHFHVPGADGRCRCNVGGPTPAQCAFRDLWDKLNAPRGYGWDTNCWVWALTFRRIER